MKTIILLSMTLLAFLLAACSEEEGCVDVSKGTGMTHPAVVMKPYVATSVNCDGIAEEYDGRYGDFSYSEILADINSRIRIKLIHDGNEPSWAPETITIGQLLGCEYTTRPAPDTKCGQRPPVLYYTAVESANIDQTCQQTPAFQGWGRMASVRRSACRPEGLMYNPVDEEGTILDRGSYETPTEVPHSVDTEV